MVLFNVDPAGIINSHKTAPGGHPHLLATISSSNHTHIVLCCFCRNQINPFSNHWRSCIFLIIGRYSSKLLWTRESISSFLLSTLSQLSRNRPIRMTRLLISSKNWICLCGGTEISWVDSFFQDCWSGFWWGDFQLIAEEPCEGQEGDQSPGIPWDVGQKQDILEGLPGILREGASLHPLSAFQHRDQHSHQKQHRNRVRQPGTLLADQQNRHRPANSYKIWEVSKGEVAEE